MQKSSAGRCIGVYDRQLYELVRQEGLAKLRLFEADDEPALIDTPDYDPDERATVLAEVWERR